MEILDKLTGWLRGRRPSPRSAAVAVVAGTPLPDDSPLVRQTAERLRQREQAAGGWAAEAGEWQTAENGLRYRFVTLRREPITPAPR